MRKSTDTKIDTHKALLAANAVMTYGTNTARGMHWHGITVLADPDGYTVTLTDDNVELRLLFHNKFQLQSKNRYSHVAFVEKLDHLIIAAARQNP
jgi:4-hydroxyphenylpyruvate dioxygenase-like putative hemolysin|tara:strand:- start:332 stop:616 length:285 start_codon:yes stop_codon:yes gene_type:complete